jgi:hypothetical protein
MKEVLKWGVFVNILHRPIDIMILTIYLHISLDSILPVSIYTAFLEIFPSGTLRVITTSLYKHL